MKLYNLACEDKGLMPSNTCQPIKFKGPYNHLVYVPSLKKKEMKFHVQASFQPSVFKSSSDFLIQYFPFKFITPCTDDIPPRSVTCNMSQANSVVHITV